MDERTLKRSVSTPKGRLSVSEGVNLSGRAKHKGSLLWGPLCLVGLSKIDSGSIRAQIMDAVHDLGRETSPAGQWRTFEIKEIQAKRSPQKRVPDVGLLKAAMLIFASTSPYLQQLNRTDIHTRNAGMLKICPTVGMRDTYLIIREDRAVTLLPDRDLPCREQT